MPVKEIKHETLHKIHKSNSEKLVFPANAKMHLHTVTHSLSNRLRKTKL